MCEDIIYGATFDLLLQGVSGSLMLPLTSPYFLIVIIWEGGVLPRRSTGIVCSFFSVPNPLSLPASEFPRINGVSTAAHPGLVEPFSLLLLSHDLNPWHLSVLWGLRH